MNNEYDNIINMTNADAADIIENTLMHLTCGRGNGKTITQLRMNTALLRAIVALRNEPSVDTVLKNIVTTEDVAKALEDPRITPNMVRQALRLPPIMNNVKED